MSGLKTTASSFSVAINAANFDPQRGILSVIVNLQSTPAFERITVSYVIFARVAPFNYIKFTPLRTSLAPYIYYGIDRVNNGVSEYSGYELTPQRQNLLQCQGATCPASCVSQAICTALQGNTFNSYCIICNSQQYFSNG